MDRNIEFTARLLAEAGVRYSFGVTGSGLSLALITELESNGVKYFPASHEAAAAIMAGAVTRLTGRLSVAISIRGPGLANMIPGITYNYLENNPVLSISEALGVETPAYKRHKRLDHTLMVLPIVKAVSDLSRVDQTLGPMLDIARAEIPGPVHLELCRKEVVDEPVIASRAAAAHHVSTRDLTEILSRIERADRPLLIVGSLALRRSWRRKLSELRIPVFTTAAAKGALDETLEQSSGIFTGDGKELSGESVLIPLADLIVGLGLRNSEVLSPKRLGPTILLDEAGPDVFDGFCADVAVGGVTADSIDRVLDNLRSKEWGLDEVARQHRALEEQLSDGWLPAAGFRILNDLPYEYVGVMDTGLFCTVGEHVWNMGPRRPYVASSNGRFMGVSIPLSVGAAVCSDLPVLCVVGDGGIRNYVAEMKLAVRERLPLCVILMSDGRYGSVACISQRRPTSNNAVAVPMPSWYKAMRGMGCAAYQADSTYSFSRSLAGWSRAQPLFIEANFKPDAYATSVARLR